MDEKIEAARVQGKYGLRVAVITGICSLLVAAIGLVPSLINARRENMQLKEENASLIAASEANAETTKPADNDYQAILDSLNAQIDELQSRYATSESEKNDAIQELTALQEKVTELEQTNDSLQQEQQNLLTQIEEAEKKIAALQTGLDPSGASPTGTPDDSEGDWLDFLTVLSPYEASTLWLEVGNSIVKQIEIMGKTYQHGIELNFYSKDYAMYNLEGKYTTLEFDMGHIDGAPMYDASFQIYLDGKLAQEITGTSEMNLTHFSVPLNQATQLKIMLIQSFGKYGLVNIRIR